MRVKFEVGSFNRFGAISIQQPEGWIDRLAAHTHTDAQSDENIISANLLRSLGGDKNKLSTVLYKGIIL